MIKDMNLFFNPESEEYLIISEGYSLKLNKADFKALKKSMNGISYALKVKCRQRVKEKLRN